MKSVVPLLGDVWDLSRKNHSQPNLGLAAVLSMGDWAR